MTDKMKALLEKISRDEQLAQRLKTLDTREKLIAFAKELGVALTEADFEQPDEEGEVSIDEADAVAGGKTCVCVYIGEGKASGENDLRCSCGVTGAGDFAKGGDTLNRCVCALGGYGKSGN